MNWNPEADLSWREKQGVLAEHFDRYGPFRFVIETGIWEGNGSCFQFEPYAEVVGIEIDEESAALARERGHDVRTGDARVLLPTLLASRDGPAFVWLDAHNVVEAGEEDDSSLEAELEALLAWPHAARSVVLIDDVRMMGRKGWPTLLEVCALAWPTWAVINESDILRLIPR